MVKNFEKLHFVVKWGGRNKIPGGGGGSGGVANPSNAFSYQGGFLLRVQTNFYFLHFLVEIEDLTQKVKLSTMCKEDVKFDI